MTMTIIVIITAATITNTACPNLPSISCIDVCTTVKVTREGSNITLTAGGGGGGGGRSMGGGGGGGTLVRAICGHLVWRSAW